MGIILLVVFSGTAILELVAISGFNSAVKAIGKRMPSGDEDANAKITELPSRVETEKILGKKADGPLVKMGYEQKATYTWRGVRKHVLTAYYTNEKEPNLIRYETGAAAE